MIVSRFLRTRLMNEESGGEGSAGGAAPSPAPAEAPAPAPAATPEPTALTIDAPAPPPAAEPGPVVAYESTGDAGMDLALKFVGNLGLGPEHAAMKAAEDGDFTALEATLKGLGEKAKGYEDYLALAKQWVGTQATKAKERFAKEQAMVHDVVGGPDKWEAITSWARENAEPHEKEQVNAALKAGGIAAKAMAVYLNQLFSKAAGTEIIPAPAVQPGASPHAGGVSGPITAQQFAEKSRELRRTLGPSFESTPAFKELAAQRQAGMRAGR